MERGAGKQDYKECIDSSFTVYIFLDWEECISQLEWKDWRYGEREKIKKERGAGEAGVVKTQEESGYCKE